MKKIKDGYFVIAEYGQYSVIIRQTDFEPYIVANGLQEDGTWNYGHYFSDLFNAVDYVKSQADERHISYNRMNEIASKTIDSLREDDEESCREYCKNEIEMDETEMEYFGLSVIDEVIGKNVKCIYDFVEDNICYWSEGNLYKILSINDEGYEIEHNYGKGFIYREDFNEHFIVM